MSMRRHAPVPQPQRLKAQRGVSLIDFYV